MSRQILVPGIVGAWLAVPQTKREGLKWDLILRQRPYCDRSQLSIDNSKRSDVNELE